MAVPYLQYQSTTVWLDNAVIVPYTIEREIPASVSRTEDKKLKVYLHSLAGSKKRIWHVTCIMHNLATEHHRWSDMETFYHTTVQGPKVKITYYSAAAQTYTVRIISFKDDLIRGQSDRNELHKVAMLLEEDYS